MKKSTLDHLITFAMVIVAYLIVQILIAAGVLSSLMQGLLVPMCTYSIVAIVIWENLVSDMRDLCVLAHFQVHLQQNFYRM